MEDVKAVDPGEYRRVLGHLPTGVAAVTATCADGTAAGMLVGSFISVSLDPPLVGFLPQKTSTSWPRIRDVGSFCVNILGSNQTDVGRALAVSGGDKFANLSWWAGSAGHPVVEGVEAWIECDLYDEIDAGDHYFVLGSVRALSAEGSDRGPLVFCRGGYSRLVSI